MISPAIMDFLGRATPALIYLIGVIYLYRELQKMFERYVALIDRYHKLVEEHVHTLTLLNEQMERALQK